MPLEPGWIILILLVVLLLAGLPIAFVLGVTAATVILLDPAVVPQIMGLIPFGGANNYLLVAALLFMIAGEIMNQGRIAEKLIAFASSLVGHIRGGLAHVNILTSLFFSEISGTATSDAAAIGSVMIPQMKKRGYPVAFAAAVTSTSATMAIIVPPSLNLILYAYVANASIAELFAAGILPGFMVCGLLMLTAYVISVRRGYPTEGAFSFARVLETGKDAAIPLTLPILVLAGILGGIITGAIVGVTNIINQILGLDKQPLSDVGIVSADGGSYVIVDKNGDGKLDKGDTFVFLDGVDHNEAMKLYYANDISLNGVASQSTEFA